MLIKNTLFHFWDIFAYTKVNIPKNMQELYDFIQAVSRLRV